MSIYTRGGDRGQTSLGEGARVNKDDVRVRAYGEVDECNAALGMVRAMTKKKALRSQLLQIQKKLLAIGAIVASLNQQGARRGKERLTASDVAKLERWIDQMQKKLSPLHDFVIPGGCEPAAVAHLARVVCRRAERAVVSLNHTQPQPESVLCYLNRLSDYLFVLSRLFTLESGQGEELWS